MPLLWPRRDNLRLAVFGVYPYEKGFALSNNMAICYRICIPAIVKHL